MQLTATSISHDHGAVTVLDDVSLTVAGGDRIGLIGPNGVGKSTLLRILAGLDPPDRGTVTRSPAAATVAYLAQELTAADGETVADVVARRTGVRRAEREMDALAARLEAEPGLAGAYSEALERFLALGGSDFEGRARAACAELGMPEGALDRALAGLSGGERARAGLVATLVSRHDVLLLDEPTNDLDADGLARLDRFLAATPAGVVLVTHDRALLRRHAARVIELDQFSRRATTYEGGWAAYERERDRARDAQWEAWREYDAERARLRKQAIQKREWARQGAHRARTRRTDNAKALWDARAEAAENLGAGAGAIEKRMARLDAVEKPREPWRLRIGLQPGQRAGEVVARLDGAVVERGDFVLGPVNVEIGWQERIALTGRNGSGKSTLIDALLGTLPLTAGSRTVGTSTVIGSIDQARSALPLGRPLIDAVRAAAGLADQEARALLATFGLESDDVDRPVGQLSPGERSRAELALLSARGTNFVVLDEPTNHLDLAAIEPLEEALAGFDGTLLVVSHDTTFVERLRLTRTVAL